MWASLGDPYLCPNSGRVMNHGETLSFADVQHHQEILETVMMVLVIMMVTVTMTVTIESHVLRICSCFTSVTSCKAHNSLTVAWWNRNSSHRRHQGRSLLRTSTPVCSGTSAQLWHVSWHSVAGSEGGVSQPAAPSPEAN